MRSRNRVLTLAFGVAALAAACTESTVPASDGGNGSGDAAAPIDAARAPDLGRTCVDADRDGVCSDLDCNDQDAARYPGNTEVCDVQQVDEDCDPQTLGGTDADGDGVVSDRCCNGATCGQDCDDTNAAIALSFLDGPPNGCDGIDNDCDGTTDPGCACLRSETRPCGATEEGACAFGTETCTQGAWGACLGTVTPTTEVCNGLDDDCNGSTDETFTCASGQSRPCMISAALPGTQDCLPDCSRFTQCRIAGDEGPTNQATCNGLDDDDDGLVDENFECRSGATSACTTTCGTMASRLCNPATCSYGACRLSAEVCNYCDDNEVSGILDEIPLAVGSTVDRFACSTTRVVGRASCATTTVGNVTTDTVTLIDDTGGRGVGAAWLNESLFLGWGKISVEIEVTARHCGNFEADGGWALILAQTGSGDLGTVESRGVPVSRSGMAFTWQFRTRGDPFNGDMRSYSDRVDVAAIQGGNASYLGNRDNTGSPLPSGGANSLDAAASATACVTRTQRLYLEYTPQDPSVAGNEERLVLTEGRGGGTIASFVPDTPDPFALGLTDDLTAGRALQIGLSASNESFGGGALVTARLRVVTGGTPTYPANAARLRTCP